MPSPAEKLPAKLLKKVFNRLETPSHIEAHLEHDPVEIFDEDGHIKEPTSTGLKTASLVCRQWYKEARPRLMRHLHIHIQLQGPNTIKIGVSATDGLTSIDEFFGTDAGLASLVQSVTVSIKPPPKTKDPPANELKVLVEDLNVKMSNLLQFTRKVSPSRFTIVATGMTFHTCFHEKLYFKELEHNTWSPRLRLLSLSGTNLNWQTKPTDASWERALRFKSAWVPLRQLLTMCDWREVIVNEGVFSPGCQQGLMFDSQRASIRAALRKLKRTSINDTYAHVEVLTCVDGYDVFTAINLYAEMAKVFEPLKRFRFRARPLTRNGAQRLDATKRPPSKRINLSHSKGALPTKAWPDSPDVIFGALSALDALCDNATVLHEVYEFPDLASSEEWPKIRRAVRMFSHGQLVSRKPGELVPV